jgi:hypothetical protein
VSDVVMSLVEAPDPAIYTGLGDAALRLPAYYVIKATKADAQE